MIKDSRIIMASVPCLFFFLTLHSLSYAEDTFRIGFFELKPHIYIGKSGIAEGSAVDYWENWLLPEMNAKAEWVGPLPYSRLMEKLKTGIIHAGIILGKNPEREHFLYYPEAPFYSAKPVLAVRSDFPLKGIGSVRDMAGMRICYVMKGYLSPFMRDSRITFDNLSHKNWAQANLLKLVEERCDGVYFPELNTAEYYKNQMGIQDRVREIVLPEKASVFYTAFSKKAGSTFFKKYSLARKVTDNKVRYGDLCKKYIYQRKK